MTALEQARLMIQEMRKALAQGTKHYDPETGELLPDEASILNCLKEKGSVVFEPREKEMI